VFFGNPAPIAMIKDFPETFNWAASPAPFEKTSCRVPPPPQPSFFTVKLILKLITVISY